MMKRAQYFCNYTISANPYAEAGAICSAYGEKALLIGGEKALAAGKERLERVLAESGMLKEKK